MKPCGYCGRANHAASIRCFECGTEFPSPDQPVGGQPPPPPAQRRVLPPGLCALLKATGAFVLVASAGMIIASRIALDHAVAEHGGPIGKPGIYAVGMLAFFYSVLALILIVPLLTTACVARHHAWGLAGSLVGVLLMLGLFCFRSLNSLLPARLLGKAVGQSWAYYTGAAVQAGLGVWLLLPSGKPRQNTTDPLPCDT